RGARVDPQPAGRVHHGGGLPCHGGGLPRRKKPPEGPPSSSGTAHMMPEAPSRTGLPPARPCRWRPPAAADRGDRDPRRGDHVIHLVREERHGRREQAILAAVPRALLDE